ncbi:MAG TPA: metal ABC transporter ATP-binding protein [Terriglobales bacterium]|nr:metal ABC transporter ATP-binding protein [Terriglobales bacterium]
MSAVVRLDHVGMAYAGTRALEDVTFTIDAGDYLGIIGPNGSGKTTLLKLILGLLPPTEGRIELFGADPKAFRDWTKVGYVPQRAVFDPTLPVRVDEVVLTGLVSARARFGAARASARQRVTEALETVGMGAHAAARIGVLSAGQQQRVLIARALVSDPALLILDEPTGGVDPEAQAGFHTLLRELNATRGVTLVLVSHDVGVVARDVSKLACLNQRVIFCGHPHEFVTDTNLTALYGAAVRRIGHEPPCAHAG